MGLPAFPKTRPAPPTVFPDSRKRRTRTPGALSGSPETGPARSTAFPGFPKTCPTTRAVLSSSLKECPTPTPACPGSPKTCLGSWAGFHASRKRRPGAPRAFFCPTEKRPVRPDAFSRCVIIRGTWGWGVFWVVQPTFIRRGTCPPPFTTRSGQRSSQKSSKKCRNSQTEPFCALVATDAVGLQEMTTF